MTGVRLAVLDDGQFVRTRAGTVHPRAATFHRFVEQVAREGRFERVRYVVPVHDLRVWEDDPPLGPVDAGLLEIVPTAPFGGIGDYLARAGWLMAANWRPIREVIADADLVWLRLPASNGLLALTAARRAHVAHFGWIAGSAAEVAAAQDRPPGLRQLAIAVGTAYDAVSELAGRSGPLIRLDAEMFASVVTHADVATTRASPVAGESRPWRVAWAGRMAGEKGLDELLDALRLLVERSVAVQLVLIGDGPDRPAIEARAAALGDGRVTFEGYVGERDAYLGLLRGCHVLAHPSGAEGVPKVVVEGMAAGVPVVAADTGGIAGVLADGRGRLVPPGDPVGLADAIGGLLSDPYARHQMRARALAWVADHTAEQQARHLVDWMRRTFPDLRW